MFKYQTAARVVREFEIVYWIARWSTIHFAKFEL